MKSRSSLPAVIAAVILLDSWSHVGHTAPPQDGKVEKEKATVRVYEVDRGSQAARVDALFAPWSRKRMPGAAVLVVQNGQILHKKGYGLADIKSKTRIRPDTSFLLASTTKSFTALAIMILADRGLLTYKDSLSKYFPQFPDYARDVTIRHLLNHTAGFPEYDTLFIDEKKIDDNWPRSSRSRPSFYEPTSRDALDLLSHQEKLLFDPGVEYSYSNSGYVILGQIVEKVSKKRFREFVADEIFHRLGMNDSLVYDETRPEVPKRATSYSWKDGKYRNVDYTPLNMIYGEDGIYTTLDDMVYWVKAIDDAKLAKPETWKQAFTRGRLNNKERSIYGFGWFVEKDYVWHNGEWLGFRSYIAHHPQAGLNVVVLSNCKELNASSLGAEVAGIYLGDD